MEITQPASDPKTSPRIVNALAGLEAGVVGVFWMAVCFAVFAVLGRHGLWVAPNVYSTAFYGEEAAASGFLRTTWSGLALMVFVYGVFGAIWGLWWGPEQKPLLRVFGALTGLIVYFLIFGFVWPRVVSDITAYAPVRELQVAHIVWGAVLASSPGYTRAILRAVGRETGHQEATQSATGEVIR